MPPNRLTQERSPYLQQHRNNPVDWYPWGEEAFTRARSENKPIHLSIGYSACHWCHVMAHESFENGDIARQLNRDFISIKVDREERPDLDQLYQMAGQVYSGSSGWPLTVFLTPELKPFFAGTYFPPEDRHGRPGFPRILEAVRIAYQEQREAIQRSADEFARVISSGVSLESAAVRAEVEPDEETLRELTSRVSDDYDPVHGGAQGAPKFPNPSQLTHLWRAGTLLDLPEARDAVVTTLNGMAKGGIYDQLGGGFCRYSVDEHWHVPHFEKMLYDNALLLKLYAEVLLTRKALNTNGITLDRETLYLNILDETAGYVFREMTSPEGLFYSSQDADSEGEEGKFYLWTREELQAILDTDEYRIASHFFGLDDGVLYQSNSLAKTAEAANLSEDAAYLRLESARRKLFEARRHRTPPGRDDKILTRWNTLMVSGLAWAGMALREYGREARGTELIQRARQAYDTLKRRASGKLPGSLHAIIEKDGPRLNPYLPDYAYFAQAALDLSRTADARDRKDRELLREWTLDAMNWCRRILQDFTLSPRGGYAFTTADQPDILERLPSDSDEALPSGTAVALSCMTALSELTAGEEKEIGTRLPSLFSMATQSPAFFGETLSAALLWLKGPIRVSGADARQCCIHPHVFQGETGETDPMQVCHRHSCRLQGMDPSETKETVARLLRGR